MRSSSFLLQLVGALALVACGESPASDDNNGAVTAEPTTSSTTGMPSQPTSPLTPASGTPTVAPSPTPQVPPTSGPAGTPSGPPTPSVTAPVPTPTVPVTVSPTSEPMGTGGMPVEPMPTTSGGANTSGMGGGGANSMGGGGAPVAGAGNGGGGGGNVGPAPFVCPADPGTLNLGATVSMVTNTTVTGDGFAPDFSILEGPVWVDGALYFSHMAGTNPPPARIYRFVPGSPAEIFKTDSGANGLALDQNGDLLAARHLDGSISRIAMSDGAVTSIAGEYMGNVFSSPNDLVRRSDGNIYFTDPNHQKPNCDGQPADPSCPRQGNVTGIYRIDPQGEVSAVDTSKQNPNGIHLSLDENSLLVTGSMPLTRYPVMADGSLGAGQTVPGGEGIQGDGMTLDCLGNLYVAMNSEVRVVNSETGAAVGSFTVGAQATNVAFGGPNRTTLYITTLGNSPVLYSAEVGVVGLPY